MSSLGNIGRMSKLGTLSHSAHLLRQARAMLRTVRTHLRCAWLPTLTYHSEHSGVNSPKLHGEATRHPGRAAWQLGFPQPRRVRAPSLAGRETRSSSMPRRIGSFRCGPTTGPFLRGTWRREPKSRPAAPLIQALAGPPAIRLAKPVEIGAHAP